MDCGAWSLAPPLTVLLTKGVQFRFLNLEYRHRFCDDDIVLSSTERFPSPWPTYVAIQTVDRNGYRFAGDVHFSFERRGSPHHRRVLKVPSGTVSAWATLSC